MPDEPHFLLAESPGRGRGWCFCLGSGACTQAVRQRKPQGTVAMGSYRINRPETEEHGTPRTSALEQEVHWVPRQGAREHSQEEAVQ